MQPEHNEHGDIKAFIAENKKLIEENNKLLRKINRNLTWTLWVRIVWYAILLGIPFALSLYFYPIFSEYFNAVGSDYDKFQEGIRELPGFKNFDNAVN